MRSQSFLRAITLVLLLALAIGQVAMDEDADPPPESPSTASDSDYSSADGSTDYGDEASPSSGACDSASHTQQPDETACIASCESKSSVSTGEATVDPRLYTSKTGATCCSCRFKRVETTESDASDEAPARPPPPIAEAPMGPPPLDPASFKPPTSTELEDAVNPMYIPDRKSEENMVYAVLRVAGMPWELPLPLQQITAFVYAYNNITGQAWQFKYAVPAQPDTTPSIPLDVGLPPIKDATPAPPAMVPVPPAAPPEGDAAPVVDAPSQEPLQEAPQEIPQEPMQEAPQAAPQEASQEIPQEIPPGGGQQPQPQEGQVETPVVDEAVAPLAVEGAVPRGGTPTARRLLASLLPTQRPNRGSMLLSRRARAMSLRRLAQYDGVAGPAAGIPTQEEAARPQQEEKYDPSDTEEYEYDDYTGSSGGYGGGYNDDEYGEDEYEEYRNEYSDVDPPPPPPSFGGGDGGGARPSPPPPPPPSPPPPPEYDPSPSPAPFEVESPPPPPPIVFEPPPPPPEAPPPPVPPPPPPPPPPLVALPENMDGIWYFAQMPMDEGMQLRVSQALGEATKEGGPATFLRSLQAQGLTSPLDIELRYIGTAPDGFLDLTKRLDGDVFGASTDVVPPPPPSSKSTSTVELLAIIGGVVGGVVILALVATLLVSSRRRARGEEKAALTQRWRAERELAEAERMRLSGAAITGSLRQKASASLAAHESGMVAMTQDDLARQRQSRRAEAAVTAARLSERQFAASPSKSEGSPAKPSRLDSMRSALGLNRLGSVLPKRGSSETKSMSAAQQPRERSADRGWTVVTGAGAVSDGDNAGNKSWKQRMFPSRKS